MPLVITPELGIPLPVDTTPEEIEDFREKARVLCETVKELIREGADVAITPQDEEEAHELFAEQKPINPKKITPGTVLKLEALLTAYDKELLNAYSRLRNFVTNRLLEETENEKASDRLRALELLGKITGVGLFSDKINVQVTHRTTEDIEQEILKRLNNYIDVVPEKKTASKLPSLDEIDLDLELGLDKKDNKNNEPD